MKLRLSIGTYRTARRVRAVDAYEFPSSVRQRLRRMHPCLDTEGAALVEAATRQWFRILARRPIDRLRLSMPSTLADDMWHEFLLHIRDYAVFCDTAFGRFLHHVPESAMTRGGRTQPVQSATGYPAAGSRGREQQRAHSPRALSCGPRGGAARRPPIHPALRRARRMLCRLDRRPRMPAPPRRRREQQRPLWWLRLTQRHRLFCTPAKSPQSDPVSRLLCMLHTSIDGWLGAGLVTAEVQPPPQTADRARTSPSGVFPCRVLTVGPWDYAPATGPLLDTCWETLEPTGEEQRVAPVTFPCSWLQPRQSGYADGNTDHSASATSSAR